jgi:hypothetical protein
MSVKKTAMVKRETSVNASHRANAERRRRRRSKSHAPTKNKLGAKRKSATAATPTPKSLAVLIRPNENKMSGCERERGWQTG